MRSTVTLYCKQCERWFPVHFEPKFTGAELKQGSMCPRCQATLSGKRSGFDAEGRLIACAWCEGPDLYRRKHFPKALGIGIVVTAAALTIVLVALDLRPPWLAYAPLFAAAAIDALLFLVTPDAIACYRCPCVHRGYPLGREIAPYDHAKADQIRLAKGAKPSA
jgi:hypothetical protein